MNYNNLIAEYLGTLLLVLSVFVSGGNAAFIGFTLAVVIFFSGKMNPGHVNPAISVAMYFKKKLTLTELLSFVIAQVLGGISSVILFRALA